jgi:tetratricopeptide (TPR) repeat protein
MALLALVLVAVFAAYANHFHNTFHFDDFHTVVDNPSIRSLGNIPRFFTDATTFSVLPANRTYRPIVSTMLALDYALGHGYGPLWFHVSTFLLFLLQVICLFFLYRMILDRTTPGGHNDWITIAGAAWYGLHPAMAETVNYVIQRGDLYCTLGCVASLTIYARWPALRKTGIYLAPVALALLSKPPAAVFPVLLFLYVLLMEEERATWAAARRALMAALPAVALTGALLAFESHMTPKSFAPSILSSWDYRMTQPYVWLRYCDALFLPVHLNVDTDLQVFTEFGLRALVGFVFLAGLAMGIWASLQRRALRPVAFGLLWFVVTQLPTSLYPLSEVENDHRMFFSFVGLVLAAICLLGEAVRQWIPRGERRAWAGAAVVVILAAYGWGTHVRNTVWRTEESLWRDDVEKSPKNGRGLMIYGLTQMNIGKYPEALDLFQRALLLTPNYATLEVNLGVVTAAMGNDGQADGHFLRAIQLAPADDTPLAYYGRYLIAKGRLPEAIAVLRKAVAVNGSRMMQRTLLVEALAKAGDLAGAKAEEQEVLRLDPGNGEVKLALAGPALQGAPMWLQMSLTQYQNHAYQQSIASAKKALDIDPKLAEAYNNIGADYAEMGDLKNAIANEKMALEINPDLQIAKNNLNAYTAKATQPAGTKTPEDFLNDSLRLNQAGRFDESIAAARAALALRPNFPEAWNNIAAAYESEQKWDQAIDAAKRAIALKPDFQLAKNNLAWSISQKQKAGR